MRGEDGGAAESASGAAPPVTSIEPTTGAAPTTTGTDPAPSGGEGTSTVHGSDESTVTSTTVTGAVDTDATSSTTTAEDPSTADGSTTDDPVFAEIPETCEQAAVTRSTVGCLFYAVDMDTHDANEINQYAVAIANVQTMDPANVTIEQKVGDAWQVIVGPEQIAPLGLGTYPLPDQHTDDSQLRPGGAYRVRSDVPVIGYQFSPIDGQDSFFSDAAMLYPVSAWDHINHAITFTGTTDLSQTPQHSYATAVAHKDGTTIKVTPSVATLAGPGVPAGQPKIPFEVTLDEGDVLSVAISDLNTSLSGTTFETSKDRTIALFAGLECALIPTDVCCCDHLEEQLSGVRLWGKRFIAARVPVRNPDPPESSLWQIYAGEDDTTVDLTANPEVTGLPPGPVLLDRGQLVELYVSGPVAEPGDFAITSDKPIAVMNYMTGSANIFGPFSSTGDPAAVQMPAIEQFLPRYVVLVPGTWVYDFGVFTRQAGAVVTIDGVPIPDTSFNPIGDSGYEVARVPLEDGVRVLDGQGDHFGVIVVGYDLQDSYAYLGGSGTRVINPEPG